MCGNLSFSLFTETFFIVPFNLFIGLFSMTFLFSSAFFSSETPVLSRRFGCESAFNFYGVVDSRRKSTSGFFYCFARISLFFCFFKKVKLCIRMFFKLFLKLFAHVYGLIPVSGISHPFQQ